MKLSNLYQNIIACGRKFDVRGSNANFEDSMILHGDPSSKIHTILVGIDIGIGEILFANYLKTQGININLIISHHVIGEAVYKIHYLLQQHAFLLSQYRITDAQEIFHQEAEKIQRAVRERNVRREIDIARFLNIPLMCIHSPADNLAYFALEKKITKLKNNTLKNFMQKFIALHPDLDAKVIVGENSAKVGNFYLDVIGGNPLPVEFFPQLANGGIKTIIAMHTNEARISSAKANHINLISLAHIAVDSLGMRYLFKKINSKNNFQIIPCGGFNL